MNFLKIKEPDLNAILLELDGYGLTSLIRCPIGWEVYVATSKKIRAITGKDAFGSRNEFATPLAAAKECHANVLAALAALGGKA